MTLVHFLNVNDGDCSVIQHNSGRITVIDVSGVPRVGAVVKARKPLSEAIARYSKIAGIRGNFGQSEHPENPIKYLRDRNITSVFRFISTHPDMDHLDGIKAFFDAFSPSNFWDTDNTKQLKSLDRGRYNPHDWQFYSALRDTKPDSSPKRIVLYSGDRRDYFRQDGLNILAPTQHLVQTANALGDWNDASYVILYWVGDKRVLFAGDSKDQTWKHILSQWRNHVSAVDVLVAPHHGRDSGRNYAFLDTVRPKITLFGNAPSEHLGYEAWNNRGLLFITNNQAGNIVLSLEPKNGNPESYNLQICVSHKPFADAFVEQRGWNTVYHRQARAWAVAQYT